MRRRVRFAVIVAALYIVMFMMPFDKWAVWALVGLHMLLLMGILNQAAFFWFLLRRLPVYTNTVAVNSLRDRGEWDNFMLQMGMCVGAWACILIFSLSIVVFTPDKVIPFLLLLGPSLYAGWMSSEVAYKWHVVENVTQPSIGSR